MKDNLETDEADHLASYDTLVPSVLPTENGGKSAAASNDLEAAYKTMEALKTSLKEREERIHELETRVSETVAANVAEKNKIEKKYKAEKEDHLRSLHKLQEERDMLFEENTMLKTQKVKHEERIEGLEASYAANHEAMGQSVMKSAEAAEKAASQQDLIERLENELAALKTKGISYTARSCD